jgi:hypothetical protein
MGFFAVDDKVRAGQFLSENPLLFLNLGGDAEATFGAA